VVVRFIPSSVETPVEETGDGYFSRRVHISEAGKSALAALHRHGPVTWSC
jgi:hypothetical protein